MIKKLHYIKEDYSGSLENYCFNRLRELYPDFEFMAWRPGSSPLRILYDHGGLFIGQNILALNRIPDYYFEKSFLVFNNAITTDFPNFRFCCYSDSEKNPLFLEFMEKGVENTLAERGYIGSFEVRTDLKGHDIKLPDLNIWNRVQFGGMDKLSLDVYTDKDIYLMDTNINFSPKPDWNVHYVVINKDTSSNKVHALCENFFSHEYKDDSSHYLLFVCNDLERDLTTRIGELINYKSVYEKKKAGIIVVGNGANDKTVGDILTEYIGRSFERLKSCERLL